jgi:hypothetical protein
VSSETPTESTAPESLAELDQYDQRFDPYCLLVGKIASAWANVEQLVDQLTWELANIEAAAGCCFTGQMIGPGPRVKLLVSLIVYRGGGGELLQTANRLGNDLTSLGAQRNRYIHDGSVVRNSTGELYRVEITADKKPRSEFVLFDAAVATKLWAEIRAANGALWALRARLIAELPSWPRTQYLQSPLGVRRFEGPPKESPAGRERPLSPSQQ